jgi:16S rRNA (guanine966-N2)-methyltransferase
MGDRQRSALFNMLGDVSGLSVFDPYGGSGSISFEALSRGAQHVFTIELDKSAFKTIHQNIQALGLADDERIRAIQGNCISWSKRNQGVLFDLIICDPPYDAVLLRDIEQLGTHVKPGGTMVLSWPESLGAEALPEFTILRDRTYANARLVFYRKLG